MSETAIACVVPRGQSVERLLKAVSSPTATMKYPAVKALRLLSERNSQTVYPHFDLFAGWLTNSNSILRWNGRLILGNVAGADSEGRLDAMIDAYLAPISGSHLIDAATTIRGATSIALAKPHLAQKIANRILKVERAVYATPECRNVAIGHAIKALDLLFPTLTEKRRIQLFVTHQLENSRPATRKKAEAFLKRWPALQ